MTFRALTFAMALGALALQAGAAQAATQYDADLAAPGFYNGSGVPNGHFTIETLGGIELGLRARPYPELPIAPTSANLYTVALGETIVFDWSFNPGTAPVTGLTALMTIKNLGTGGTASFNPSGIPDNESQGGGYQNSWQLAYGFLNGGDIVIVPGVIEFPGLGDIDYDPNVDSSYEITFAVTGGASPVTNTIYVNQGAGAAVPEPGVWALMILGFGGAGVMLRRRRTAFAA